MTQYYFAGGIFNSMGSQDHVTHPTVSLQLGGEQREKSP